jgi:hypothetical protein
MAKVYISGKITGLDYQDAFNNFEKAEQEIKDLGGVPINPMKIEHKENPDWFDYMENDLAALLRCDGIYMLNDWGNSKGARIERAVALELGLSIVYQK